MKTDMYYLMKILTLAIGLLCMTTCSCSY